ncbi:MAG: selenite/tellurite reduction operon porin ExtI [Syntrophales bacterium]|nr:selenite/tellurite reduction operon porin ExtI [Syntrophales bacterium]
MGRAMGLIILIGAILIWAAPVNALDTEEKIMALEKKVSDLEGKLPGQTSSLEQVTRFMEEHKLKAGLWLQAWYQFVEDGKNNGNDDLHDFMFRRFYFYLKGEATPQLGFFAHIAGDRIGQEGLNDSGQGLGSGIAVRDGWIYYNFHESFKVQMGRMYPPFTRNYGTTSTKALLTVDLPFTQGGVRGGIFYASKVGRDDGVVLWGNPFAGLLQYRLGISEGVEGAENPDDSLRFTGRLSLNLLEPETSWFNQGTYLGKKKVLAIGAGFDRQNDIKFGTNQRDNTAWTVDLFFDHPVGEGALTMEAAYIDVKNVTQSLSFSRLVSGDDAQIYYIQGGYLIPGKIGPGRFQPYFRYERLAVDKKPDTVFPSVGVNYYLKGHDAKLTLDWTLVDQREEVKNFRGNWSGEDQNLVTLQFQVGI